MTRTSILALMGLAACASVAGAQSEAQRPIRFARHPALSPDGATLAFSYQGNLWTVAATGGAASLLTTDKAHESHPAWSPDGKTIAFSSKHDGDYDVWTVPAGGGTARQLTFHSADDLVNDWSPDGRSILFTSARETTRAAALYAVDPATGATRLVAEDDAALGHASVAPDGKSVACTRGGSWSRKGYRGSANSDLMIFPFNGSGPGRWLLRSESNERWPLFAPDGQSVWFVSDRSGAPNLWRMTLRDDRQEQVTRHTDGNVLYPALSRDGRRLVYERNFSLWTLPATGGEPVELRIFAPGAIRAERVRRVRFTGGAQEIALSPDGKQLAFIVHGEVFVQPAGSTNAVAARLTTTPQREQDIAWSPDGQALAFVSDRDGDMDIFTCEVASKTTRQLTQTPNTAESAPRFSPDGRHLAFRRGYNGAELCMMPAAGGPARVLVQDPAIGSFAWSPDSKWIAFHRRKSHSGGNLADVFIVSVTSRRCENVTRHPGQNLNPVWSEDGRRLFFLSNRAKNTKIWGLNLQEGAKPPNDNNQTASAPASKPAPAVHMDFEDIHRRARQVTRVDGDVSSYALAPDGKSLLFAMPYLGRTNLWLITADGRTITRLTTTNEPASQIQFAPDGSRAVFLAGGGLRSVALPRGAVTPVPFTARMEIDTQQELAQMFDEAWRKMRNSFYDEKMHGCDWDRVRATYRPILADIAMKEDFYALFSLAMGELNASHTGITPPKARTRSTASLGVTWDYRHTGPGVRVKSVLEKSPAAGRLRDGDIILKVDGVAVVTNEQFYRLLADKAGRHVNLLVSTTAREAGARAVAVHPASIADHRRLAHEEWTARREELTGTLSGGRLGYLHLNMMNDENLERFKRAVFGDLQAKDGLVLDLRFNGGGGIADEMLAVLQNKVSSRRSIRGEPRLLNSPLEAWDKPVILLINEAAFSNAEVFPWGFKELGLGKIVGVPTFGGVIGTSSSTLIDGSHLRIPSIGAFTLGGVNMENHGCPPDIHVENAPEDFHARRDPQLERAVKELLKVVASKPAR